jgi:predicted lipid-binding transport protein (Tim44 family)
MKIWSFLLVIFLACTSLQAEAAKRMGSGSFGKQSGNVTQRETAKPAPANPAQNAAAVQPPRKPWGAMLGGLAAGLGLAWLASTLGLGAAFGQFILIALLVLVIMAVIGLILRSRRNVSGARLGGLAYQGATAQTATASTHYNPDKVGNDASARPWERTSMAFDAGRFQDARNGSNVQIGSHIRETATTQGWGVPVDFDTTGFLTAAKQNFVTLQDGWDRADVPLLRSMMTDEMVGEITNQLSEREAHLAGQANKTDVVMLEAQLLGIEDLGQDYMASVEFSGMIREQPSAGPSPFREVWNMTKPKSGASGWLVAGVQALQ